MFRRIGFVSTRTAGTDGVSLEIGKWTEILNRLGCQCFFVTGQSDRDPKRSFVIPEADFRYPAIQELTSQSFGQNSRSQQTSELIRSLAMSIKRKLYVAVNQFEIDLIIAQNALTIPLNIPLAVALDELLLETQLPCIAHHHDFVWERERFRVNSVSDYLQGYFPPSRPGITHIVINSDAGAEFGRRTGLPYQIIPNVMDFEQPPPSADDYVGDFRRSIGLAEDDLMFLQPTRVVPRKGIEHSIELIRRIDDPRCKLVITHSEDDEGPEYARRVRQYAEMLGVEVIFANRWISHCRCQHDEGHKCYSIWDAYRCADLVTYPSTYEGFGNAFLEAVYYKLPIFCNRYTIFRTDIEPYGFRVASMDGFLTDEVVDDVRRLLNDGDLRKSIVEHNYEIARENFSYRRVEKLLRAIVA